MKYTCMNKHTYENILGTMRALRKRFVSLGIPQGSPRTPMSLQVLDQKITVLAPDIPVVILC